MIPRERTIKTTVSITRLMPRAKIKANLSEGVLFFINKPLPLSDENYGPSSKFGI
jgi:hypothetical protein